MIAGMPLFELLAIFGGVLWAIGNSFTPLIINRLGMGMGLTIWSDVCILVAWVTGRYGLFGITPQEPQNLSLN